MADESGRGVGGGSGRVANDSDIKEKRNWKTGEADGDGCEGTAREG